MSNHQPSLSPFPTYQVIGHRGAGKLAPENTLASFKLAKALGLNWVELDTQVCGSGEWVVIHDDTLDRSSNGTGLVQKTSLKSLKTLDAGSWFNPRFCQESIPLLSEALDLFADLNLQPNIEIKGHFSETQPYLGHFLKILEAHWPPRLATPLISSYSLEILTILQQAKPTLPLGYLMEEITKETLEIMAEYQFFSLHCNYNGFKGLAPSKLQTLPFPLLLYTVDEPKLAEKYFQQGVCAIFSDFPNLFVNPV